MARWSRAGRNALRDVHGGHPHRVVKDPTLAASLVQEDGGGDRHVEAVGDAQHRQRDGYHALVRPGARQAVGLAAQHDRERSAQVHLGVGTATPRPARPARAGRRRPARSRTSALEPAARGTVKIVPRDARTALGLNRSVRGSATITASPGSVRTAQDGAQVARLLDALEDDTSGSAGRWSAASETSGTATVATRPSDRSP